MKQNPHYILIEIAEVPYLMPVGQAIADHKRGLKTNATGAYLWNLFRQERSLEDVLALSASHYEISPDRLSSFREDISLFIWQLLHLGILTDSAEIRETSSSVKQNILASRDAAKKSQTATADTGIAPAETILRFLSIGGLTLCLTCPEDAFSPEFSSFLLSSPHQKVPEAQQAIILHPDIPKDELNGDVLLHNPELNIIESESAYLLQFPAAHRHLEIHLSKDGHTAHCYSLPPYDADFRYDFFHAIRLVYLYLAQKSGMVALHSASILYQNKLWLFSGPSGTGKSTHTNLWNKLLGTPIINGDLNLLAIENDNPVVHGIPWCGTSGIYDTKTYPLGGIILLEQAKENHIESLSPDQKRLLVSQRLISPAWTDKLWHEVFQPIDAIADKILICKLHCTKENNAVEVIKNELSISR